jgi:GNAT superfamily N-acetyltransferase
MPEAATLYTVRPLNAETWPDFSRLVEANNGVWGGCWCLAFHAGGRERRTIEARRAAKEARVREGATHHALIYSGADCVGWAQFGSPDELPAINNRKAYEAGLDRLPDWRITCLFVGKGRRRQGVAQAAVEGALDAIASLGGGEVESYPEDVEGRKVTRSFLWNGTLAMFERLGFERVRRIGKNKWVVRRTVAAAGP